FSPDGKELAVGGASAVRFYDAGTGKEAAGTDGHRGPVTAVMGTADGKTVISRGADSTIRRWEAATGKELSKFTMPSGTTCVAVAPDGRTVALGNQDNSIRVHDATTGKELHKLSGPTNGAVALAFSPDGKTLAARETADTSIRVYDVEAGK